MTRQDELNETICENLWRPSTDPVEGQYRSAAKAYLKLQAEGLEVDGENDVVSVLTDNYLGVNFLEEVKGSYEAERIINKVLSGIRIELPETKEADGQQIANCKNRQYLGDGVFAQYDGFHVWLTTEDGITVTNQIALDPVVGAELIQYLANVRK